MKKAELSHRKEKAAKRLIPGERDTKTGILTQTYARNLFLDTIADKARVVLDDLKVKPLQFFVAAGLHQQPYWHLKTIWDWLACGAHKLLDPRWVILYECLRAWSKKYNAQAPDQWFEERGFFTLYDWQTDAASQYNWSPEGCSYMASLPPDPPPGIDRYDPLWVSRADYLDSLSQEALKRIKADPLLSHALSVRKKALVESLSNSKSIIGYCKEVEAAADRDGCQEVFALPELQNYMDWTIQTRILRRDSVSKIAKNTGLDYRSVQKGIKKVLDLVGFPSNRRGRPAGIVETSPRNNPTR